MAELLTRPARPWLFWLLVGLGLLLFLYLVRGILLPFVAGLAVAYFFDPVVDWLVRKGVGRLGATLLVSLTFLVLFVLVLVLVVPMIANQVSQLVHDLPTYAATIKQRFADFLDYLSEATGIDLREKLQASGGQGAPAAVGTVTNLLNSAIAGGLAVANILSLLLITPLVAFFMLLNWDAIVRKVDSWLPRRHLGTLRGLFGEMDRVLAGFLRGQAAVCAIMAVYYAAALSAGGLRYGLLAGIIAGVLTFVPFVGALVGLGLTAGLAVIQFDTAGPIALLIGLYMAGQLVESNLITPRVVGRQIGLHDLWLIFAVLAGGALFGPWGVLIAVPIAGCVGVLVRFAFRCYFASPYYSGARLSPPAVDLEPR